ncbi:precorrin-6y C5,15-methyltransferase (decarboxylating) subunit CbiE [Photobacterium lipolyticum]|uniref:Bifunctional cobalt-precorrin-7 (C(5))-methyltransferase/cobalt-precorrin-6B (C(15))-methyltransferase n=1 Tax=Photobacterium lipolyticum TaxID=266810 RepID=A0A2T3N0V9_9GAMM|nr:precorrin-6y C5,15-methyltransferase (decarboxylating) subunit CbiE [Photobacterium lipolyticum]PSW05967.1 bifunctional cobalt-precorrin-7 (C(5))-methyltransferase/cobalt-precorrin-6B (C(15))-methyltransferase [Photobacterium lipolyticum]
MKAAITIVGVPEDGCASLTSRAVNAVAQARVLAGHPRLLRWFPQFKGCLLDMSEGFKPWLNQIIDESEEGDVVVLASGDPLFYGIGSTLIKHLDRRELCFIPSPSSIQLAFARLALPWQDARCLSLHGRAIGGLVCQLQHGDLFALLTDSKNTPPAIARHLLHYGETSWQISVCEQLGSPEERIRQYTVAELAELAGDAFDPLNVAIAKRTARQFWGEFGQFADDEAFEKRMPQRGLITKQPIRHLALGELKLRPAATVWDIGTGSGSIAIEAAKQCWQGQVFTMECNEACYPAIEANIAAHRTDNVTLVKGKAPAALADLPAPDAVFVGGTRGAMADILSHCWERLSEDGVLVTTAVTIDSVVEIHQWSKQHQLNPKVQLAAISQSVPLAHYTRYQAENPIHLFIFEKSVTLQGNNNE